MAVLFHFSEDPSITRFTPHVPRTNPTQRPAVWAIDAAHESLYWFPRDCPRAAAWPRDGGEREHFAAVFRTSAWRVHAIEAAWVQRMRTTVIHRYSLPADTFEPWEEASGQWVSREVVEPRAVEPLGDLLELHEHSGIELRVVDSLWPMVDLIAAGDWDYSLVRLANATPRRDGTG
jgi:hypothetical protein